MSCQLLRLPACFLAGFVLLAVVCAPLTAQEAMVEKYLMSGKLTEGRAALEKHLASNAKDDQARFGLGVLQFMQSVEHLGQSWYKFGIDDMARNGLPFLRFPIPDNPKPEKATYAKFRKTLEGMIVYLDDAEKTLAKIQSKDVKLPLRLFQFHLDFNQDGKITPAELMTDVYGLYLGSKFTTNKAKYLETKIYFDYADVQWLRGYTHLIRAMIEMILAYDQQELWDLTAHMVFKRVDFVNDFVEEEHKANVNEPWRRTWFIDAIASIHKLDFPLKSADRMKSAHAHLKKTIGHSRAMWEAIEKETDNENEWIPNKNQRSVVSATRITPEMITTWRSFLQESEDILDGKKLIPFWRGTRKTRGLNLKKVFHQPRDLDVIMWVQGSGVVPFLEMGDVTNPKTWSEYQRTFGGQFLSFAGWFN